MLWRLNFFIFLNLLTYFGAFSQVLLGELCPNSGFEDYSSCPFAQSQIEFSKNWFQPTLGTSDFYHECAGPNTVISLGSNLFGYKRPKEGLGMAGFAAEAYYDILSGNDSTYREYISCRLNEPLKKGLKYYCKFHLSISDKSDYASSNIGMYFSVDKLQLNSYQAILANPQISNGVGNFIVDSLNWIPIEGEFIAEGGETYVTIGLFTDFLDTLRLNNSQAWFTYYFIDDISVRQELDYDNLTFSFSPNSDGLNDIFSFNEVFPEQFSFIKVYSRWGKLVFECRKSNCKWDGTFIKTDIKVPDGVYFFIAGITETNFSVNGTINIFK